MSNKIKINLAIGPCQEVLSGHEPDSIDVVVCDPPYGLGTEPDPVELLRAWVHEEDLQLSGGFMGNSWDSQVPPPSVFKSILRVLKPSDKPNAVFFSGTRTLHLMMASLRLAGFDIVGVDSWVYGSGFPKSLNVFKGLTKKVKARYGDKRCSCEGHDTGEETPYDEGGSLDPEKEHGRRLVLDDYEGNKLVTRICSWCALPDTEFIDSTEGLGSSLKPAYEPVVVTRKPEVPIDVDVPAILASYGFDADEIELIMTPPGKTES